MNITLIGMPASGKKYHWRIVSKAIRVSVY